MPLSLEHERAKEAYNEVNRRITEIGSTEIGSIKDREKAKKLRNEFKSWAKKFPSMVVSCGLLQTALFYKKSEKEASKLYEILNKYMKRKLNIGNEQKFDLVDYLINHVPDVRTYLSLSAESVKFLTWVKNFSEALIKETDREGNGG
jgi:CRISPR type III-B/RAMP module-associated protein Cmr5